MTLGIFLAQEGYDGPVGHDTESAIHLLLERCWKAAQEDLQRTIAGETDELLKASMKEQMRSLVFQALKAEADWYQEIAFDFGLPHLPAATVECICGKGFEWPDETKEGDHVHCPHCGSYYTRLGLFRISKRQVETLKRHREEWVRVTPK